MACHEQASARRRAQLFQKFGLILNQSQLLGSAPAFELAFTGNSCLAVKHNFSIGFWKNEANRPFSTPLGVGGRNVNILYTDHSQFFAAFSSSK